MRLLILILCGAILGSCNMNNAQKEASASADIESIETVEGNETISKETAVLEETEGMKEKEVEESEMMNKQSDKVRKLEAKETIEFREYTLKVSEAVTHQLGVLLSRGGDGKTWLIEQYRNGQVYNRYVPVNLAEEFMVDGLQVEFDGHVGAPPAHVRLMGSPLEIEYMAKYEGDDLKKMMTKETVKPQNDNQRFK